MLDWKIISSTNLFLSLKLIMMDYFWKGGRSNNQPEYPQLFRNRESEEEKIMLTTVSSQPVIFHRTSSVMGYHRVGSREENAFIFETLF